LKRKKAEVEQQKQLADDRREIAEEQKKNYRGKTQKILDSIYYRK